MINGYGRYGQVWSIPSELLEAGDLGVYTPGCGSCGTGLGAAGFGADWEDVDDTINALYLDRASLGNQYKARAGFGAALPVAAVAAFLWWKSR